MKSASALLGLLLALPAFAQNSCPVGQYQVCLVVCFCAPIDPGQGGQVLQDVERVAAASLAFALRQARDEATANGTQPIPCTFAPSSNPGTTLPCSTPPATGSATSSRSARPMHCCRTPM